MRKKLEIFFQWSPPDLYFLGQQIIPPSRSKIPPICFLFCFSLTPLYHCVSLCITVYHCVSLCITVYHCVSLCSATPNSWEHQLISTFQQPSFSELDAYHLENDKSAISICVLFYQTETRILRFYKKYYESAISYQQFQNRVIASIFISKQSKIDLKKHRGRTSLN